MFFHSRENNTDPEPPIYVKATGELVETNNRNLPNESPDIYEYRPRVEFDNNPSLSLKIMRRAADAGFLKEAANGMLSNDYADLDTEEARHAWRVMSHLVNVYGLK